MTKVWIDQNEDWPVYRLSPEPEADGYMGMFEVELPDELIERLRKLTPEWRQAQAEVELAVRRGT